MPTNLSSSNPRGSNRTALVIEVVKRGKPVFSTEGLRTWYYTVSFNSHGSGIELRWYTGECNVKGEDVLLMSYESFRGSSDTEIKGNEGGYYFLNLIKDLRKVKGGLCNA